MLKDSIKTMIAMFFAFILSGITYGIGNFDFRNSPLFSLRFFYDLIVLLIYYLISLFIINKIINKSTLREKALLTEDESAEYLNISIDEFKNILLKDSEKKVGLSSYDTYEFIHYIDISHGKKMFNKKELDEWINYNISR
ncbi:hypothetical protein G9F72_014315 [Clostridium estertheticum]|uniref:hypothetical protein n=1 Tax=Clostridium estertheticum TaxID=238834 RepID=UPI0013E96362|nr:hypothetical protein [Clostridium estertheticum]MBZ9687502.1 hypothetical protein [Clostridium estertheticum]